MSEHADKLRATLADLHAELSSLPQVDPEVRTMLEGAMDEIRQKMGAGAAKAGVQPKAAEATTIVQRLTAAAQHFEETHPTLSGTLGSVIDALGRMGI